MDDERTTDIDIAAAASAAWPRVGVTHDLDVDMLPYLEFCGRVLRGGIAHVLERRWATSVESLTDVLQHAAVTSRWDKQETALLDLDPLFGSECLAYVWRGYGQVSARIAARDLPVVGEAESWLRNEFPECVPTVEQAIPVTFWSVGGAGGHSSSRTVDVPAWSEIERNYPESVRRALADLFAPGFRPDGGKLLLWHGEPGTGKTFALRALAWEWREWCELHYVTDPDLFFGGRADYLMNVVLQESDEVGKWRVLVLEDTGELLAADAKERTGQGLSRLLNVVDGIFGQGLRILVLVTTNENLKRLHPAVSRPGRCGSAVEFVAFPPAEAERWLVEEGAAPVAEPATLATLYARSQGRPTPPPRRIGFGT